METERLYFGGLQNHCRWWLQPWTKRCFLLGRKSMLNLDSILKSRDFTFADKGPSSQSCDFSRSHVSMWELDYKESWVPKNWCFWTVVLEKTLESPLDCKEIKPVTGKGNQSWIFIGRTDAEAEAPILWPPDAKNWLPWRRPWCWERLKAGGEGGDRWWDGWLASPTWWTWVCSSSGSWWWTEKPGVLQSVGLQRVRHSWATELNWTDVLIGNITESRTQLRDWTTTITTIIVIANLC